MHHGKRALDGLNGEHKTYKKTCCSNDFTFFLTLPNLSAKPTRVCVNLKLQVWVKPFAVLTGKIVSLNYSESCCTWMEAGFG